jgi:hyperosmotically inducible protein
MNMRTNLLRAALFVVGAFAATAGCSVSRAPAAQADDAVTATRVTSRLTADPDTDKHEIDVDVLNDVVTLRGIVETEAERDEAERIAAETRGVARVRNLIELESEMEEGEKNDFATRVKIGTQLAADPDVRRVDIDIDVEEGIVTLSGVVKDEKTVAEAERIAMSVEGVKDVNNELQVAHYD